MLNSGIMLVVIASIAIVATNSVVESSEADNRVRNFAKVNDYLERKVNTDNIDTNIDLAKLKLSSVSILVDPSLKEGLTALVQMKNVVRENQGCGETSESLLEIWDARLGDNDHRSTENYPVRRVERILEFAAYKNYRMCRLGVMAPRMKYTYKQAAYDQMNNKLVDQVDSDEPEANMKAAQMMLESLDNKDGGYARALKLFLSLGTLLSVESCDEQGLQILMRNDLATRNEGHSFGTGSKRRVVQLVRHYSLEHAKLCHPVYMKQILPHLRRVDLQTHKRILALVGSQWFMDDDDSLDRFVAEVESQQPSDLDFSTPLLETKRGLVRVAKRKVFTRDELLKYMKAVTKREPQKSKYLDRAVYEEKEDRVWARENVEQLYDEYIIEPCRRFTDVFRDDMTVYNYIVRPISIKDLDLPALLNFRLLSSAYNTCLSHTLGRADYINGLMIKLAESE